MRIVVSGKGGSGKTTIAGLLARLIARAADAGQDRPVIALDLDPTPTLGLVLGIGPEATARLAAPGRAGESFAAPRWVQAPDGVLLLVPADSSMLHPAGTHEGFAGFGRSPHSWMVVNLPVAAVAGDPPAAGDLFLIVAEPTSASLAVGRGLAARAGASEVVIVANRVEGPEDVREVRRSFSGYEIVQVPDDDSIDEASRHGISPLELDSRSSAVRSVETLARRFAPHPALLRGA
ncbi:MAG: hypothetical protein ACRDJ4_07780 [Actinomycetota bacterium]